jgi:hypothetical protein
MTGLFHTHLLSLKRSTGSDTFTYGSTLQSLKKIKQMTLKELDLFMNEQLNWFLTRNLVLQNFGSFTLSS